VKSSERASTSHEPCEPGENPPVHSIPSVPSRDYLSDSWSEGRSLSAVLALQVCAVIVCAMARGRILAAPANANTVRTFTGEQR
jgi:hypothetical protein